MAPRTRAAETVTGGALRGARARRTALLLPARRPAGTWRAQRTAPPTRFGYPMSSGEPLRGELPRIRRRPWGRLLLQILLASVHAADVPPAAPTFKHRSDDRRGVCTVRLRAQWSTAFLRSGVCRRRAGKLRRPALGEISPACCCTRCDGCAGTSLWRYRHRINDRMLLVDPRPAGSWPIWDALSNRSGFRPPSAPSSSTAASFDPTACRPLRPENFRRDLRSAQSAADLATAGSSDSAPPSQL